MSSFVDRIRTTAQTTTPVIVHGVDPDLRTTGWGKLYGEVRWPATGKPTIRKAVIGLIEAADKHLRELDQAQSMIDAIAESSVFAGEITAVFVEAQQVYPDKDETPKDRVAKANDLLRCAQVTGTIQGIARMCLVRRVAAVLPAQWKGQSKKHVTIEAIRERIPDVRVDIMRRGRVVEQVVGKDLDKIQAMYGHALDALGIAIYGLDTIALHREAS